MFTASKFDQKTSEAPASVTVVTARDIQRYRYRTLSEVLQSVRGFFIRDDRNYDSIGVRGFGRSGDYNNRILILIDGHRVNENVYDSVDPGRGFPIDVALIDRIEIVRGPSSSLYGSSGFFGVVNVITKKAAAIGGVEVSGALGNFTSRSARLTVGQEIDKVSLLFSGTLFKSVGERDIYYSAYDDPATNNGIAERADGESMGSLFGKVSAGDFTLQGAFSDRTKNLPTGSYASVFNDPRNATTDDRAFLDLSYSHVPVDSVGLSGRVFFDDYRYHGVWVTDFGSTGAPDVIATQDKASGMWTGAELQALLPLGRGHRITLGSEYRYNLQQDQYNLGQVVNLDDRRDSYSLGVYAQDELRVADDLILNAGLRYDYYSASRGTLSPRFAAIYQAGEATTLKGIYGHAFRAPSPYELYYNAAGSQKPNPDLNPETIDTFELVLEQGISKELRGTASVFHYQIDDLVGLTTDPADGLLVFENVDRIRSTGFEVEVESHWPAWLRGRASYSFQNSELSTTGGDLTNSPRHVGHLKADAEFAEHFVAAMEVNWVSSRLTPQGTTAAGYAIANLNVLASDLKPGLEMSASVKNLFDKRFDHVAGEEHLQDVLADRGRVLWFQVTYRF